MPRKLYTWLTFNFEGNLRGFSSGFTITEAKRLMNRDVLETGIVAKVDSTAEIPSYFLESYYWKFSKENDLKLFLAHRKIIKDLHSRSKTLK